MDADSMPAGDLIYIPASDDPKMKTMHLLAFPLAGGRGVDIGGPLLALLLRRVHMEEGRQFRVEGKRVHGGRSR